VHVIGVVVHDAAEIDGPEVDAGRDLAPEVSRPPDAAGADRWGPCLPEGACAMGLGAACMVACGTGDAGVQICRACERGRWTACEVESLSCGGADDCRRPRDCQDQPTPCQYCDVAAARAVLCTCDGPEPVWACHPTEAFCE
jgi:hypothetical protein